MKDRRSFLSVIASLPLLGWLKPKGPPKAEDGWDAFLAKLPDNCELTFQRQRAHDMAAQSELTSEAFFWKDARGVWNGWARTKSEKA